MKDLDSFLKEIGRSYFVSSLLPAVVFFALAILFFKGFLPNDAIEQFSNNNPFTTLLLILFFMFWIAFYLFSATDFTVKLFEGYYFPEPISIKMIKGLKKNWYLKLAPHYFRYLELEKKIEFLSPEEEKELQELKQKKGLLLAELQGLELQCPMDEENLLPTRLGNMLRASEIYAYERYWIEEITIWPRLFHTLPRRFINDLEEKNNHLLFLLNSAFLVYLNALISFIVGLLGIPCILPLGIPLCQITQNIPIFVTNGYNNISPFGYLGISFVLIPFGYILYRVAVNSAGDYGLFVRASYDLYRMNLLKQLNWKLPKNLLDERNTWIYLSTFFIAAERLQKKPIAYPYHYHSQEEKNASDTPDSTVSVENKIDLP